jgi:hypothetical protein
MGRSIQGFISSTTSKPTKKARNRPGWRRTQDLLGKLVEQSETSTRQLTVEEALELAILLQKNQQLAEAHELYRRVLSRWPQIILALCTMPAYLRISRGAATKRSRSSSGASP